MKKFLPYIFCSILVSTGLSQQKREGAKAILDAGKQLALTETQVERIDAIKTQTIKKYRTAIPSERAAIRKGALKQAMELLTPGQKEKWYRLVNSSEQVGEGRAKDRSDVSARSLTIPSIDQLKKASRGVYGPTTSIVKTKPHLVNGRNYIIITDHTDATVLEALHQLADYRNGKVIRIADLGQIYKDKKVSEELRSQLLENNVKYVAIAPTITSYRENLHLFFLKLLTSLDSDPDLDAFFGYLMSSTPDGLSSQISRILNYSPLSQDAIKPLSIGAIEDDDSRRYRSYQKAKIIQKMFADKGKASPSVIITTRKKHVERSDFPDLESQGDIAMLPKTDRYIHREFSEPTLASLAENNMLFMFGHGTTNRICGTNINAFANVDFTNEIVFCGSCMSAAPYHADRLNLDSKRHHKRFAFHAMDNGAIMLLGHMALCGGFPKIYPMSELVLEGRSTGEAYQQLMNSLISSSGLPDYYPDNPPTKRTQKKEAANGLLYVLWGDPALVVVDPS